MRTFIRYIYSLKKKYREFKIKRLLKKNKNIFDDTNYFYGAGTITLKHTLWGKHSGIGDYPKVYDTKVGNFTNIASSCRLGLRDHIHYNFLISDFVYRNNEQVLSNGINEYDGYWISIGSDVWIGEGVMVLRGVKIGDGAVIGAGSVVTKSIPPFAVAAGNPAKFVKWRFPKEVRERLMNIRWWDWPDTEILKRRKELEELVGFDMNEYKTMYIKPNKTIEYDK